MIYFDDLKKCNYTIIKLGENLMTQIRDSVELDFCDVIV